MIITGFSSSLQASTKEADSLFTLMTLTNNQWNERGADIINAKIKQYCQKIAPEAETTNMSGFLEKCELEPGSDVAVIGDIHGNALRLDLTLKALQKRGYLDQEFRLLPGKNIVFLGDYLDRGSNSLKVLELVLTLKIENPEGVHLLRGNHEDVATNRPSVKDPRYSLYLLDNKNWLSRLYKSLSVGVYLGQKSKLERKEFVHCTHALFFLYTDPAPLFESTQANARLWVSCIARFSDRIQAFKEGDSDKLKKSADQIEYLVAKMRNVQFDDVYWLDVGPYENFLTDRITIPPKSVEAYMKISGTNNAKVKETIRGHQGRCFVLQGSKKKPVVTTIDPSVDDYCQIYLEMKVADKVRDWKKSVVEIPLLENHAHALDRLVEKEIGSLRCENSY